ncbi:MULTISPECIES: hypothetical protein [Glaesserella]|uniref:Uncharacterized protein n=1 Tax=Glaesserella australis TaxID=2094024 RepID=A0A328BZQ1_9PAST|nr:MULTISPECIES: hypothetical protein [Glaesserella]AUI66907.1 hypothetical protein CJD39_10145 [Glaesserella sp. 15-184]RAL19529.1 hypothetical protein C5N92_02420 [Glaesserella australis]
MPVYHFEGQVEDIHTKMEILFDDCRDEDCNDNEIILTAEDLAEFEALLDDIQSCIDECDSKLNELEDEGQEPNADDIEKYEQEKEKYELMRDQFDKLQANHATLQDLVDIYENNEIEE